MFFVLTMILQPCSVQEESTMINYSKLIVALIILSTRNSASDYENQHVIVSKVDHSKKHCIKIARETVS